MKVSPFSEWTLPVSFIFSLTSGLKQSLKQTKESIQR